MVISEKLIRKHRNALNKQLSSKSISRRVILTLLAYTIAMITVPLAAYYLVSYLTHGSSVLGATASIIAVHLILAIFVYKAIGEPVTELESKED